MNDPGEFFGRVLDAAIEYDENPDEGRMEEIGVLYGEYVEHVSTPVRRELLTQVLGMLEEHRGGALALVPFLRFDPEKSIVSSAALGLAVLYEGDDVLDGPREVVRIATGDGLDPVRAARVLQGALLLGDRRMLPDLAEARRRLDPEGHEELTRAWSGLAYASMVDFYLDWLEEDPGETVYGAVAAAVARMPRDANPPFVMDVERWYPVWSSPDGEPLRVLSMDPFHLHARSIEPRLRELLRRESEPKILPQVFRYWGLDA